MRENGFVQVHVNVATSQKLVGSSGLFAGKPAPTGFSVNAEFVNDRDHCGSGLARDEASSPCKPFKPETQNANPKVGVLFSSSAA